MIRLRSSFSVALVMLASASLAQAADYPNKTSITSCLSPPAERWISPVA